MTWARREVIRTLAAAGATRMLPSPPRPRAGHGAGTAWDIGRSEGEVDPIVVIDGSDVRALAQRVLDAAKSAGAHYADVRFTRRLRQKLKPISVYRPQQLQFAAPYLRLDGAYERLGVGVRVRVGAGWGFAASPYWDPEDVVRLAREAAVQAKTNARGSGPADIWAPIPAAIGHWATPIKVDPFLVSLEEKSDVLGTWMDAAHRLPRGLVEALASADFTRDERALATSEGTYVTQTLYSSEGEYQIDRVTLRGPESRNYAQARGLARAAVGWELFANADIVGQLPHLWEEADPRKLQQARAMGSKAGDVGRYTVVFDAKSMGRMLERTLGVATQLDRALGLEANAGGTSYLGPDPLALLGSYETASPVVTVTANRSMPLGFATVKWDDEGVTPDDFPLVKDGVLVDYQTTREQAAWLAPYYQKQGKPVRSHGCAWSECGLNIPLQQAPNLVLAPGQEAGGFDELVASIKKGLAVLWENPARRGSQTVVGTDFQARTGSGRAGQLREIVDGKLGAVVEGLTFTFNTTGLWKNVEAVGGTASAVQYAARARKGQPAQQMAYSVRAVPAKIKDVDFITPRRR